MFKQLIIYAILDLRLVLFFRKSKIGMNKSIFKNKEIQRTQSGDRLLRIDLQFICKVYARSVGKFLKTTSYPYLSMKLSFYSLIKGIKFTTIDRSNNKTAL